MPLINIGTENCPTYVDPEEVVAIGPGQPASKNPRDTYQGFTHIVLRNRENPTASLLHPDAVANKINEALGYPQEVEEDESS